MNPARISPRHCKPSLNRIAVLSSARWMRSPFPSSCVQRTSQRIPSVRRPQDRSGRFWSPTAISPVAAGLPGNSTQAIRSSSLLCPRSLRHCVRLLSIRLSRASSGTSSSSLTPRLKGSSPRSLDDNENVKLFVKLPRWFRIDTPIGPYNPDRAFVTEREERLYFVRETKSTLDSEARRIQENQKMACSKHHFEALEVDFDVVTRLSEVKM